MATHVVFFFLWTRYILLWVILDVRALAFAFASAMPTIRTLRPLILRLVTGLCVLFCQTMQRGTETKIVPLPS